MAAEPTYRHSPLPFVMRAYNRAARGARRIGWSPGPLHAREIAERARRRTGFDEFGFGDWREPLEVLVASLEREAALSPFGRTGMRLALVETLSKRLRIVDHVARRPRIADESIERPLFVLGFPRTGTTLLYNLLALDPGARPLLGYEAAEPLPRRTRVVRRRRDPRIVAHDKRLRRLYWVLPELRKVHAMGSEQPEECNALMMRSVVTWYYGLICRVPGYERWLTEQPRSTFVATYRLHETQLKLLQHQRRGRYWLLKSPIHLNTLDALLEVYPDACIVQTHRDPARVHPSTCSLIAITRSMFSEDIDPVDIGREALEEGRRRLERFLEARSRLPAERFHDVRYADLIESPAQTVTEIYRRFEMPVPDGLDRRVAAWLARNPRHKHGAHRYSLEAFGTSRDEIDRLSESYRQRFAIPREP